MRDRLHLVCLLGGLLPAACGGPISDFPRDSAGSGDPGGDGTAAGDGGDGSDETPDSEDPDDGLELDAGAAAPPDAGDAGPGADGGVPACSHASEPAVGSCYGIFCATTETELASATASSAACGDPAELALVCEGALPRSVASCSAAQISTPDAATAITACVRADAALGAVSDDCIGCYVAEAQCAFTSCFEACFGGVPGACEACRTESCAPAFATCSGLPN